MYSFTNLASSVKMLKLLFKIKKNVLHRRLDRSVFIIQFECHNWRYLMSYLYFITYLGVYNYQSL